MSSSKSIAAARNRRSSDQSGAQVSRPNKSISGQPSFSQQAPGRIPQQTQQTQGPTGRLLQEKPTGPVPITKLSVSDAIGLVTLRLGRLEQFMIDVQSEGGIHGSSTELPENTQLVDKSVINSIVNRLDSLEKRESTKSSTVSTGVNVAQIAKLETDIKEIKEMKDLLLNHIMKFEKHMLKYDAYVSENEEKMQTIHSSIADIETDITEIHKDLDLNKPELIRGLQETHEDEQVVVSDLKQTIQQELANESF